MGMGMGTFEIRICLHVRVDDPGFFDGRWVSEDLKCYVEEKHEGCQRESAHGFCHHHGGEDGKGSETLSQPTAIEASEILNVS